MIPPEARAGRAAYETAKHTLLAGNRVQSRKLVPPSCGPPYKQGCDVQHQGFRTVTTGNSRSTLSDLRGILMY